MKGRFFHRVKGIRSETGSKLTICVGTRDAFWLGRETGRGTKFKDLVCSREIERESVALSRGTYLRKM